MCLISKYARPKIATEDITVYKVLQVNERKELVTPVQQSVVPEIPILINTSSVSKYICRIEHIIRCKGAYPKKIIRYKIGRGFIHSFQSIEAAIKKIQDYRPRTTYIVKSIIPAGSKYHVGINGDMCSDKLFLQEIIEIKKELYTTMCSKSHLKNIRTSRSYKRIFKSDIKLNTEIILLPLLINGINYKVFRKTI